MSFTIGPLPEVFALAAWSRIAAEVEAEAEVKAAMHVEAMRLHNKSAVRREFVRGMGVMLHGKPWAWERGRVLLKERLDEEPCEQDLLEALYQWFTSATNQLYRRGQIRALLANGKGHVLKVLTDGDCPAPCGASDQQILEPTGDVMKRMPPCSHPMCSCRWLLIPAQS